MNEEIYNEKELKALEEEIRALGIPYSQNEPDERYFANFRVRVMERIEEKTEKKSITATIWSWLSSSPVRYLSLGAGLAAIIVAVMLMQPAPQQQIAQVPVVQQHMAAQPEVAPAPKENPAPAPTVIAKPKVHRDQNLAVKPKANSVVDAANKSADFAAMDEILTSDTDEPVNYESLSESELESVLAVAQSMK
ncbi:MAG: hypothetical protein Q8916_04335 [Bacteroidota bacterium]|nr:hypothetical protein [Bacteroidota bacterium]MDP4229617.1 hypothetical protein [Bacteroidota bacterium]MDP4235852.1 hypothetical protein [Bacteroidota bacterium]